jgi:membrane-bound serine protease (ClpP class)
MSRLLILVFALGVVAAVPGPPPAAQEAEPPADETAEPAAEAEARGKAVYGKIDGEIGLAESAYVKRLIEEATATEAEVLVIELNTFGGRVDAAVSIRDALLDAPMITVVFINKRAISAGALISLACEKIAISPGGTIGAATPITTGPGQEMPQPVEEKYLSYFRQEMRVTAETRGRDGDIAEAMVDADAEVPEISEKGKLLTLTTRSALEYGIADVEATSVAEALDKLGLSARVEELERSWSEGLVSFLTSQAITSMLFLAMVVLAYLEYQTPGFGIFGGGAIACFLLLYFSHYLVNLAGWEELLLFVVGVVLVMVELFAIPGFGLIGFGGLLMMLASAVLLLLAGDWSDFSFTNPFTLDAVLQVAVTLVLSIVSIALLIRYVTFSPRSPLGRRLMLAGGLSSAAGFESHEESENLVGQTGTALTPLRPAGKARLAGRRFNVETEGDFIAKGSEVRVLHQEPGRIVVRRV